MSKIPDSKVVTRFAPSPTGTLHIGGARTALFNWLYARHTGGRFLLRIEDTDRERSRQEHVDAILGSLKWLGLDWDGEPVFQASRADRHRELAGDLLARGLAYRCYCTPAELEAMRETARAEGRPPTYNGMWRDRDPAEAPPGIEPAVRLRTPREGETAVDDKVQGRVVFQNKELDDLIILRSDASPTYNFAVVADDHDMGITHVIRGVDHLNNAARQTQVYRALGWDVPVFAHVPLIHGPDGAKLSKRHGAQGTEEYRAMGYLPVALRNYLVRLGWSHGNDEIISTEQMIEWFDLDGIGRSAARFDFAKLADLNGHYIRKSDPAEIRTRLKEALPEMEGGPELAEKLDRIGWQGFDTLLPAMMERAKTLEDIADASRFLVASRPLKLDGKAARLLDANGRETLRLLAGEFESADWQPQALELLVRAFAEKHGRKLGHVAQPLRAALTGSTVSPPVFDVMVALGREEAMARIADQTA
ncbi:MAG: glutamate--tRNA ligase [Hyphomicrobiaceae bacterium]